MKIGFQRRRADEPFASTPDSTLSDAEAQPQWAEAVAQAIGTLGTGEAAAEARADLPEAWAGLTDAELEAASGVPGAKFCHNARFIAVAATREAALRMAELAVAEAS